MEIPLMSNKLFNKFRKHLPAPGNAEKIDVRMVLSCAIWVIKYGHRWCELPEKYGKFDTIRKRFSRWSKTGIFRNVFRSLSSRLPKKQTVMVDSTVTKAHRTAASMATDGNPRQIGRSVGGLTTKIHLIANIDQIPLDFILTGGQANDGKIGAKLITESQFRLKLVLADKAYDTDKILKHLRQNKIEICIPPKSNRKKPHNYDKELYKKRGKIENMFGKLKDWRGIAMRYCRTSHIYDSFCCVAFIALFSDVR